jgi:hypothetical protein
MISMTPEEYEKRKQNIDEFLLAGRERSSSPLEAGKAEIVKSSQG